MKHSIKTAALSALCLMTTVTTSAYDFGENDIWYNIISEDGKTCEVTGISHYDISNDITIPEVVNGYKVTEIGDSVFIGLSTLSSISIPKSIATIGAGAFAGCRSLTSITIPENVSVIGFGAFAYCSSLKEINVGLPKFGVMDIECCIISHAI